MGGAACSVGVLAVGGLALRWACTCRSQSLRLVLARAFRRPCPDVSPDVELEGGMRLGGVPAAALRAAARVVVDSVVGPLIATPDVSPILPPRNPSHLVPQPPAQPRV